MAAMTNHDIRVIGVPRSGTNIVKYLIEQHSDIRCHFNHGWWKHAVIPPLMEGRDQVVTDVPTIVMYREPVEQIVAFFRFGQRGGAAIRGADTLSEYIRSPVILRPGRERRYWVDSPVSYWTQFYDAALECAFGAKAFIDLADVWRDPECVLRAAQTLVPDARVASRVTDTRHATYMGRNADRPVDEDWGFEAQFSLSDQIAAARAMAGDLSPSDRDIILNTTVTGLLSKLREQNAVGTSPVRS